jgi:hypothetical protein
MTFALIEGRVTFFLRGMVMVVIVLLLLGRCGTTDCLDTQFQIYSHSKVGHLLVSGVLMSPAQDKSQTLRRGQEKQAKISACDSTLIVMRTLFWYANACRLSLNVAITQELGTGRACVGACLSVNILRRLHNLQQ